MSRRPLLISHRTQMGTQPENSLPGIEAALACGVDAIECDVRASADGEVLLLHDVTLARTTGEPRALASVTAKVARGLDVLRPDGTSSGAHVPLLSDALEAIRGRAILVIEVKEPGLAAGIARCVREAGAADWCWVWSFDPATLAECRAALPDVPASLLVGPLSSLPASLSAAVHLGCAGVSLHRALATEQAIDSAHRRGLAVYAWTVNDEARAATLVADDIDGVCSDVPERLDAVVRGGR